jgi:L-alanine-DL-glutamate epimerase-like enolase superfamily enzyme
MKIWPFDVAAEASNGTRIHLPDLDTALQPFRQIRDAVGRQMEIMVELHGLWTLPPVLRIAEALRDYEVAWLEEPIRYNELDAMAELARHTSIPVAASERLASRQVFKQLIDRRAASIIMIDLAWCGGLSEARKIANLAEASELPVTLHDCTGPIVYAASCALSATLPNAIYQEMVRAYATGWYTEIVDHIPTVTDGRVAPLEGAGLGLQLRPELFQRADASVRVSAL